MPFFIFLQASYLVGVSDPNSQSGHQGLVDPIQFARANQAIQMACQNLVDPASSPSQVTVWLFSIEFFFVCLFFWLAFSSVFVGPVSSYHCCEAHLCPLQCLSSGVFQNSQSCSPETFCTVSQRGRQYNS